MAAQAQLAPAVRPINFAAVSAKSKTLWGQPASYAFVTGLSQVPIADSELLLTSHHLPIAIDNIYDEPRVVALTSPRFQLAPALSDAGEWTKGYMPIALRCLPFRFNPAYPGKDILEVATNLEERPQPRLAVFASNGTLSPEVAQVVGLLKGLEAGKLALRAAAEQLLMADVIAPFHIARLPAGHASQRQFFTVDQNRFAALTPSRAAVLAASGFLALDLAAACIFSQRLMATLIELAPGEPPAAVNEKPREWDAFSAVDQVDIRLNDDELFSFERFSEMSARHDKHH